MLVLEAWGNRASSFWTTNKTNTFLDKAEPSSRASKTSFRASSCIAEEGATRRDAGVQRTTGTGENVGRMKKKYNACFNWRIKQSVSNRQRGLASGCPQTFNELLLLSWWETVSQSESALWVIITGHRVPAPAATWVRLTRQAYHKVSNNAFWPL